MPRSGTKLLRDLLNRHSQIAVPEVESLFLPMFIGRFGRDFQFTDAGRAQVWETFTGTSFYHMMQRRQQGNPQALKAALPQVTNWAEFFNAVCLHYAPKQGPQMIYGDKTPRYLLHLPLIKELFPTARIVHIIRDPRDQVLSMKNTWNKNLFLAAEGWQQGLSRVATAKRTYGDTYLEVRYEALLRDTAQTLQSITRFLGIAFEEQMTTLERPSERVGDAKGSTKVESSNLNKFEKALSKSQIKRIEALCFEQLTRLGYTPLYATQQQQLSGAARYMAKATDMWHMLLFRIRKRGLIGGITTFARLFRQNRYKS